MDVVTGSEVLHRPRVSASLHSKRGANNYREMGEGRRREEGERWRERERERERDLGELGDRRAQCSS